MALYKGTITTAISGKIDGLVFSHNAGGKYIRNLAIPTNPNTPQQQAVRSAFALLTAQWFNQLTQGQRDAWTLYADNVPVINRVGESVNLSGLSMYVRCNTAKKAIGLNPTSDGPTRFSNAFTLQVRPDNATEAAQTIDFPFTNDPLLNPWTGEAGSVMLAYVSRPQNASIEFFKGPYRFAGFIQGDPIPPTSPFTVSSPFPFVEGQKIFTRQIVAEIDGRISAAFRGDQIAVA